MNGLGTTFLSTNWFTNLSIKWSTAVDQMVTFSPVFVDHLVTLSTNLLTNNPGKGSG